MEKKGKREMQMVQKFGKPRAASMEKYWQGKKLEKQGMSAEEIASELGYAQKTSWYTLKSRVEHKIGNGLSRSSEAFRKRYETGMRLEEKGRNEVQVAYLLGYRNVGAWKSAKRRMKKQLMEAGVQEVIQLESVSVPVADVNTCYEKLGKIVTEFVRMKDEDLDALFDLVVHKQ